MLDTASPLFHSKTMLFICPIYPCNAHGACNLNNVTSPNKILELNSSGQIEQRKALHEAALQRKLKNKKFSSFGYDRPENQNIEPSELGIDYDNKRFVPIFEEY